MRVGLLQLPSGISGDMFLGALVDAGAPLDVMRAAVTAVGGPALSLSSEEVLRAGVRGVKVSVELEGEPLLEPGGPVEEEHPLTGTAPPGRHVHDHAAADPHSHPETRPHSHRSYKEIVRLLNDAELDSRVRENALKVFGRLAEAEAALHGVEMETVHFHEVGSWDAIADVVGTVAGIHSLGLERLYHGPISVGGGTVTAAHGVLPVPAPATVALLRERECRFEDGVGELTTPTGAALVAVLAEPVPAELAFTGVRTGYGAGSKDPRRRPNLARLMIGEISKSARTERVAVVEASLDDCTPEEGGDLLTRLLGEGALDVTLTPQIMKKGRPGFLLRVIAPAEAGADFAATVTRLSTTLGARWRVEERVVLERRIDTVRLPDGEVRVKIAVDPDGVERPHPEHDDVATLAATRGVPLSRVRREVERVWFESR